MATVVTNFISSLTTRVWRDMKITKCGEEIIASPRERTTEHWPVKGEVVGMLTRNLLVARWCTEQGEGAVLCATAYISLVFT